MSILYCYCYGYHRDLHVRTQSFPTRRSSDMARHHDLSGVGRGGADKVFGFHGTASVQYSSDSMMVRTRLVIAGFAASSLANSIWRRSEEHTSELQSLMRISYAVFCLKKKKKKKTATLIIKIHSRHSQSATIYNQ